MVRSQRSIYLFFSLFWQIPLLTTLSLRPAVHCVPPLGKNNSPVVSPYTLCNKYRHTCTACLLFMLYAENIKSPHLESPDPPKQRTCMDALFGIRAMAVENIADLYFYANAINLCENVRFRAHVCEYVKPKIFCQY
jgi:hypothetical protein